MLDQSAHSSVANSSASQVGKTFASGSSPPIPSSNGVSGRTRRQIHHIAPRDGGGRKRVRQPHHRGIRAPRARIHAPEKRVNPEQDSGPRKGRENLNKERGMNLTYPSREEAKRYRREIHEAAQAVRNGETPDEAALAWPAGLDRRLLLGLPTERRTRLCLLRAEVAAGDDPLTVNDLLRVRHLTAPLLPHLLRTIATFLDDYIETFAETPNSADVAAMRLNRQVATMTPTEITVVDERVLRCPPAKVHTVSMKVGIPDGRVSASAFAAKDKAKIARSRARAHRSSAHQGPRTGPQGIENHGANRPVARRCGAGRRRRREPPGPGALPAHAARRDGTGAEGRSAPGEKEGRRSASRAEERRPVRRCRVTYGQSSKTIR